MTWRNPVNGRLSLYIASHAYAVEGLGAAEARALLDELIAEATRPEFTWTRSARRSAAIVWATCCPQSTPEMLTRVRFAEPKSLTDRSYRPAWSSAARAPS